jgi:hypothetical protein
VAALLAIPAAGAIQVIVKAIWQATAEAPQIGEASDKRDAGSVPGDIQHGGPSAAGPQPVGAD